MPNNRYRGKTVIKICPSCNNEFISLESKKQKYCSSKCFKEKNEIYMDYNCDVCKKKIRIKKQIYNDLILGNRKSITCSKECSNVTKQTGHDVECENCGKIFHRRQYLIDKHEHIFCSNKCQFEYQHKQKFEYRKCEICGAEFECSKTSSQRFCSKQCNSEWQKTLTGINNSSFTQVLIPCSYCGQEHYVKPSRLSKQNHFFCNEKCRQDWYANIWSQREEWRQKKKIDAVKILQRGKVDKVNSKPQEILDNILDKNNINYEREKSVIYYAIDNYLCDYNLMIEVQGDYWHTNPIKYMDKINKMQYDRIAKDKRKHTYIKNQYGIEILYLWENDLYNRPDLCETLIKEYINSKGILNNYNSFNYYIDIEGILKIQNNIIIPYQEKDINEYKSLCDAS